LQLSSQKQNFINYIETFTERNGRPPSFVEIMNGLDIKSLGAIHYYVGELEKDGVIQQQRNSGKRALSILEKNLKITLPLFGVVQAGYPLEVFENSDRIEVPLNFINEKNFVLQVRGDSMIDDHIQNGDYIIIQESVIAIDGDLVIAYIDNNATLKRFYKKNNRIELHPSNPDFDTIVVNPEDDFRIGGKLLSVLRKY
jgi:repressor LexA